MCQALTTAEVAVVFAEAVRANSGQVTQAVDDGRRLFARSRLPFVEEVRPQDSMQGGLALRATESELVLHPYLFREVCSNGAIMSWSLGSWQVVYSEQPTGYDLTGALQEAVDACSEERVFTVSFEQVRNSTRTPADLMLAVMPLMSQLRDADHLEMALEIMVRLVEDQDDSRFSLMNAVTSVARDTRDPEQKWRLEELGGGIGAGLLPEPPVDHDGVRRAFGDLTAAR